VADGIYQGSRTHLIELMSKVVRSSDDFDFFLFLDNPASLATLSDAFSLPNVFGVKMPSRGPVQRLLWQLPRLARMLKLDILHTQYVLPPFVRCKRVVTIHDILFETHSRYFRPTFVARSRLLVRQAALRADQVITVSKFSQRELERVYGIDPSRIAVAYNGVDLDRFLRPADDQAFLQSRGLAAQKYLLSVGRLEPRKNQHVLIESLARLSTQDTILVIVGQRDFWFHDIFDAIKRYNLTERVRVFEDVSDVELPALYRNAKAFVFPAVAEGFGMPVLEAMAAGTPVIATDCDAFREIAAGAAQLVDTSDPAALSSAIGGLIAEPDRCEALRTAGIARAKVFTWSRSADILRASYLSLIQ
jgi:glycosyltransferase involved in cell wall biosynthesis